MIKWGILGLGNMAQQFSNAILETSNAKLIAVASLNSNRLNNFAKLNKIDNKYKFNSYESLLNYKDIDAVYISTLNNTHAELTIKAAQANKHILCEKPMAIKYEDVIKVFKQLKKSKVFFFEALAYSLHPQINSIISVIKSGEIGKIEKIKSYFGFRLRKIKLDHRLFDKKLGGGAILDLGCYPISFCNIINNINSEENNEIPKISNIKGSICSTGVDEFATAEINYKSGIYAEVGVGIRLNMNNITEIFGSKGKIKIDQFWLPNKKSYFEIQLNDRSYKKFTACSKSIYANQIELVSKYIKNNMIETEYPGISWKNSSINMNLIDKWKNNL